MNQEQLKERLAVKQELLAFHIERTQALEIEIHKLQAELITIEPEGCLSCGA